MAALRDNHTHSTTLTRAGQCVLSYPWMQAALNGFFAPFYEDLHLSHSINATFDAYRMIDKTGATFYLPAWKAELEVGYNQKGPSISVLSTKGGQQGKQKGMLKILQAAMIEFAPELRPLFRDEVRMFIHFNDFPMTYKRLPNATKLRVPAFAMAGTKQALEVPIPDFTFAEYEKVVRVRAKSSGWPHLAPSILRAGRHSWVSRKDQLFWRGCVQAKGSCAHEFGGAQSALHL
uniref:Uncharacterized protein n=1 Tax=Chrysotila carterae TaxID=13221 RepID=A0A7S4BJJ4_CHRCT|mmetsp:Transcript_56909/g.123695  ORF Transcript_56909/g.123695 Transcript_56909/m.123695 type:complete len:233 (-) Transcript_56909:165-863(-)